MVQRVRGQWRRCTAGTRWQSPVPSSRGAAAVRLRFVQPRRHVLSMDPFLYLSQVCSVCKTLHNALSVLSRWRGLTNQHVCQETSGWDLPAEGEEEAGHGTSYVGEELCWGGEKDPQTKSGVSFSDFQNNDALYEVLCLHWFYIIVGITCLTQFPPKMQFSSSNMFSSSSFCHRGRDTHSARGLSSIYSIFTSTHVEYETRSPLKLSSGSRTFNDHG